MERKDLKSSLMLKSFLKHNCNYRSLSKQSSLGQSCSLFGIIHRSNSRNAINLISKGQIAKIGSQNHLTMAVVNILTCFKIFVIQTQRGNRENKTINKKIPAIVSKSSLDFKTACAWVKFHLRLILNLKKDQLNVTKTVKDIKKTNKLVYQSCRDPRITQGQRHDRFLEL